MFKLDGLFGCAHRIAVGTAVLITLTAPLSAQIQISDAFELQKIGKESGYPLNGHYEMTASFSAQGQQGGLQWTPIGSKDDPFTGTFDGKGRTISNLYINRAANAGHVGLFGYVSGDATIRNLTVTTATDLPTGVTVAVTGGYNVGILAGTNNGTITDCETRGTVSAAREQSNVGGLVGSNSGAIIRSFSNATVNGTENIGGLVGILSGGNVRLSYAQGPAGNNRSKYIGGLIGYIFGGTVHQCYATGMIRGNEQLGGLIGYDFGSARIGWNSPGKSVNGTVQKAEVTACFWDRTTTGQITSAGGMGDGRTTGDMTQRGTFASAGWDFSEGVNGAWVISGGYPRINIIKDVTGPGDDDLMEFTLSYSVRSNGTLSCEGECEFTLRNGQMGPEVTAIPDNGYRFARWSDGNTSRLRQDRATANISFIAEFEVNTLGIPDEAIPIYSYEDLKKIGNEPGFSLNGYYVQMGDIDASESRGENGDEGFDPIGRKPPYFGGTFDGKGYTIRGLYINRPDAFYVGLFATVSGRDAVIKGVNVVNAIVIGKSMVGALVGIASGECTITNCSVSGDVHGSDRVGGLVGSMDWCDINDCYSAGSVNSIESVASSGPHGGLVGSKGGSLTRCYSTADVNGKHRYGVVGGGLVGENDYGPIIQCFATGHVVISGNNNNLAFGGLVGYNNSGKVTESYSTGKVIIDNAELKYTNYKIGGLVGWNDNDNGSTVTNSYWDITTSDYPPRDQEWGTGLLTPQMYQRSTYVNWDFVDVWAIDEGQGYPFLRSLGRPVIRSVNQPSPPQAHRQVAVSAQPIAEPRVSVIGRHLRLTAPRNTTFHIRVVDLHGRTVAGFNAVAGNSKFSLNRLSSGSYLVELRDINKNRVNILPIMVR